MGSICGTGKYNLLPGSFDYDEDDIDTKCPKSRFVAVKTGYNLKMEYKTLNKLGFGKYPFDLLFQLGQRVFRDGQSVLSGQWANQ